MSKRHSSWAGVVAVGLTLGFGELFAGVLPGVPSPLSSVGSVVVDLVPPIVEDFAISVFGTADKTALLIGTIVIALLVGIRVGRNAAVRFGSAIIWFGAFGVIGFLAALRQPDVQPILTAVTTIVAITIGIAGLRALLRAAVATEEPTDGLVADPSRRRFLGMAAGTGAVAAAAGLAGRQLLTSLPEPEPLVIPEASGSLAAPAAAQEFTLAGITPIVVPNDEFYLIDTALLVPRVNTDTWQLSVTGMVDNELVLTHDDLLAMPLVEDFVTIACVSNKVGGDLIGNAKWSGVRLVEVLEMAGVQEGATQLVGRSVDDWTAGFPTELAFDGREPLIALTMNGEPLPARHGFPARLIVPGLYGYVSATKWLEEIHLTTWEGFDGYWVPRGWSKEGPIKTQSRIDVPRSGQTVTAGTVAMGGVAWAPLKLIEAVEVSIDNGEWVPAELSDPLSNKAWVQWKVVAEVAPGDHTITVRATDGTGYTQTTALAPPRPDGATGHHTIGFKAT